MFFYHIPHATLTWRTLYGVMGENTVSESTVIVYNTKTDTLKLASPELLRRAGLKDTFTRKDIKNVLFFNLRGEMLHEEYDIRHILRQSKRREDITINKEILCGRPV